MAKAATKEKESAKPATPERVGIHPEHREQAERLIARGKQQGYLTQEDIARGIPDAEAGEIEELLVTLDYPGAQVRFERGALPAADGHGSRRDAHRTDLR